MLKIQIHPLHKNILNCITPNSLHFQPSLRGINANKPKTNKKFHQKTLRTKLRNQPIPNVLCYKALHHSFPNPLHPTFHLQAEKFLKNRRFPQRSQSNHQPPKRPIIEPRMHLRNQLRPRTGKLDI